MKKRHIFYSIATLAVIVLIAGVISYATESRSVQTDISTHTVEQPASPETSTETEGSPAVKKKACGCCSERMARLQEQIRKARERRQATQQAAATEASQQQSSRASATP